MLGLTPEPIRNDLDQGRACGRTCGAQVNVPNPAMARVARAATQLSEDRPHHDGLLEPDVARQAVHRASERLIMKTPSGRRWNPLRSSTACEATLSASVSATTVSAPSCHACSTINAQARLATPRPRQAGYHAVADLDRQLRARRSVECDVAHNSTIHDHLMDPPGRRLADRAQHRPMASRTTSRWHRCCRAADTRMPGWLVRQKRRAALRVHHPRQHQSGHCNRQRYEP